MSEKASGKLRVCAAVSGRGTVLKAVIEASRKGLLPLEFCGFVADRPCRGLEMAASHGIPAECRDFATFPSREDFDEAFEHAVLQSKPDLVLLHYNRLVSSYLLNALPGRVINTHYSLLPSFRGFRAIPRALAEGVCFTGVTIHTVTERVDDGPILAQAVCPIDAYDTESTLGRRLFAAAVPLTLGLLASAPNFGRTPGVIWPLPEGMSSILSVALSEPLLLFADEFVRKVTPEAS